MAPPLLFAGPIQGGFELTWYPPAVADGLDGYIIERYIDGVYGMTISLSAETTHYLDTTNYGEAHVIYTVSWTSHGLQSLPSDPVLRSTYPHCSWGGLNPTVPPQYYLQPECLIP